MILPARRLLIVAALWFTGSIAAAIIPSWLSIWLIIGGVALLLLTVDAARLYRQPLPEVQREVASSLPQTVWCDVKLNITTSVEQGQKIQLKDSPPEKCEYRDQTINVTLIAHKLSQIVYRIKPLMRGDLSFGQVHLRLSSPWQLWQRQELVGKAQKISIFPNFAPITQMALQTTITQAGMGFHKYRKRGQGMEFEQLREYRSGDAMRQIDWKATTRMRKMISREYQDERNQRILIMLDCGRRMGASEGELTHFDHALDAVLLLSYVGLRYDDSVGLLAFGGSDRYLPPVRSVNGINRVLHEVYDLQPSLHSSDFEVAAQSLIARERKRSLVVLFTNLRDEDEQSLQSAVKLLSKRHLVLVASLREAELDKASSIAITNQQDAALRAASANYQAKRQAVLTRLRSAGILCLDVQPQQLAVESVNRYLAIKAAGKL
ncbi:DUF58 domain-containing protein [Pragia fontium]|uniref:Uncharacterized conserved protein, DUF58 family, contains vWF domain n=1 Tax=Pragia fontium DSM 5563 = ATCC 49100 TaxID=1122977 RepID=A0AAJ4W8C7_9GAMM|nr:DUF58 domain-containing protein [Pragia fontium]SFC15529.1 Uncharacterized conserved protein, DUF58 family, contains vWF domain [Pragia fontium DSM 5563 = ATCC 49100]VEJ53418.1 Uncharacterized conserved protein (some members contain a von Willebrand factor type A (vWA) domain) [Pragia fontium]